MTDNRITLRCQGADCRMPFAWIEQGPDGVWRLFIQSKHSADRHINAISLDDLFVWLAGTDYTSAIVRATLSHDVT